MPCADRAHVRESATSPQGGSALGLETIPLERFENRGYRAVQLEAGAIAGRIYLAAYAQRPGATGLTFFDDVIKFFSPHAKGKSAIFLLAIGKPLKCKPVGPVKKFEIREVGNCGVHLTVSWNQALELWNSVRGRIRPD